MVKNNTYMMKGKSVRSRIIKSFEIQITKFGYDNLFYRESGIPELSPWINSRNIFRLFLTLTLTTTSIFYTYITSLLL